MSEVLQILADNARLSVEQIAAMTGKTTAEVAAEIDWLERDGVIKGYKAIVDWDRTDRALCVAQIEVKVTPKSGMGFEEIAATIAQFDEVEDLYLMSGGYDLCVTVTGKSFKEVALFVSHRLAPLDSVLSTATHFILRKYKDRGVLTDGSTEDTREVSF